MGSDTWGGVGNGLAKRLAKRLRLAGAEKRFGNPDGMLPHTGMFVGQAQLDVVRLNLVQPFECAERLQTGCWPWAVFKQIGQVRRGGGVAPVNQ